MKNIGYYNGQFGQRDQLGIPMDDRGCYFGDGVYEALYVRNHIPFALEDHLDRLFLSLDEMRIAAPLSREKLAEVIHQAAQREEGKEFMLYFQITRGTYPRVHAFPPRDVKANLMLFTCDHGLENVEVPVSLITQPDTRWLHCNIKSLNLIPSVLASQKAAEAGCYEAIFHRDGVVTECASSNLLIVENGVLRTAPLSNLLLAGVTRKHLLELARKLEIPVLEQAFTLEEMMTADEVMVSNTVSHGLLAKEIDGKPVGGKAPELVRALQQAYREKVAGECGA